MSTKLHNVSPTLSRRAALSAAAGAGVAVGAGTGMVTPPASADTSDYLPRVRRYARTRYATPTARHLVNRFSYGLNRPLFNAVRRAGGAEEWFAEQLNPHRIADPDAAELIRWFPRLRMEPIRLGRQIQAGDIGIWDVGSDIIRWSLLRRIYSTRQLHEVMAEFWLNHLHVHIRADFTAIVRMRYDQTIREHALGRFDEMLQAAVVEPSMLLYLDADLSRVVRRTRRGQTVVIERINENLGRELLELHTVGKETRYSEDEVRDSANLLTGWQIDRGGSWSCGFREARHKSGAVSVLGFRHGNALGSGREAQRAYLDYLAHHPATARRIATKLAVRFVSDEPSEALVMHLADVFHRSGTDIKATLVALVKHPEFLGAQGTKVRTPSEDLVATHRVLGTRIGRPRRVADAANEFMHHTTAAGQEPFAWAPPDGFPDSNAVWSSSTRFLGSMRFHHALGGGYYPTGNVTFRRPVSWLPKKRLRFDTFVDHLCRVLHHRPSTPVLLGAACLVTDTRPGEIISAEHRVIRYRMALLLATLLDTPAHMTR